MNYAVLLISVIFFTKSYAEKVEISCPDNCICDIFKQLKRVACTNQNLLNIADIPSLAVILDVSYNSINILENHEFYKMNLTSLKLLNISHNMIGHMHMNAFNGLDNLKTMDLSYNIIEYILPHWFYNLPKLQELYLNNNNIVSLPLEPFIESDSLEILDISHCGISHIKKDTLSKLPKLKILHLQGNSLIELKTDSISNLPNLQALSLTDNPFKCNTVLNDLFKYLKKNQVRFQDTCNKPKQVKIEKFQKMIALNNSTEAKNLWIYDNNETVHLNQTITCNCTNSIYNKKKSVLMDIIEMSPFLSIIIPFIVGITMGAGSALILACNVRAKSQMPKRRNRYSIIRRVQTSDQDDSLVLNCEDPFESTPMPQRKFELIDLK